MKQIESIAAKRGYRISYTDKSGNWRGAHHRGGHIIISGTGFTTEFTSIKNALQFLK